MAQRKSIGRQVRRRQLQLPPIEEYVSALERGDEERAAVVPRQARAALPCAMQREVRSALRMIEAAKARGERVETPEDVARFLSLPN